jgi:hypothetical protein
MPNAATEDRARVTLHKSYDLSLPVDSRVPEPSCLPSKFFVPNFWEAVSAGNGTWRTSAARTWNQQSGPAAELDFGCSFRLRLTTAEP